ncbi:MAG: lycopene cyclase [Chitinophagaceae bacterium]|nr:lycopene cyclase [Chitinophagaceae bacterium]
MLMRMIRNGGFKDKKILLIDKEPKTKNDRTWCFWEKENGFFEEVVYRKWDTVSFLSNEFSSAMNIAPYRYKMIRGIDFYNYCFEEIRKHDFIEVVYGTINNWHYEKEGVVFVIDNKEYLLGDAQVFNSVYQPAESNKKTIRLLQHFKGWLIETKKPSFNPGEATMMDFRVHQHQGTTFAYVLPFSTTLAMVEYTLFTKELLPQEQYDKELQNYISAFLGIEEYTVKEEEFGIIPMTNEKFSFAGHGWQIGTAGGQTKASSGFTFHFIQKQSQQIVDYLLAGKSLNNLPVTPKRFRFYDNTLLHILYHNQLPGDKIFSQLFKKNKPQQVLRFLDNESSLRDELKIISSLPTWPFLKAALKQL